MVEVIKTLRDDSSPVLGPLLFSIYINNICLSHDLNKSFSALFADDLSSIFIFKKPGHIKHRIKAYLESLVDWWFKWRLKMNAKKCCFTIYSQGGGMTWTLTFV